MRMMGRDVRVVEVYGELDRCTYQGIDGRAVEKGWMEGEIGKVNGGVTEKMVFISLHRLGGHHVLSKWPRLIE